MLIKASCFFCVSPTTVYVLRACELRSLWLLRTCSGEEERQIRLLPLHRQQRKMPRILHARRSVDECFADLLKGLVFDDQVMDWIVEALHQSHADEKRLKEDAITCLQEEETKIQNPLDRYTMIGVFELNMEGSTLSLRRSANL
jgi:hypothetical protein